MATSDGLGPFMRLLSVVVAIGACRSAPAASATPAPLEPSERGISRELDELLRLSERGEGIAGVSVAVVSRGLPVLVRAYGLADVLGQEPMRPEHVFRIGSITKTFTAAAILRLEAHGQIVLEDPIVKYVPELPGGSGVTLRHLLTHTSGVPNYTDLPWYERHQTEKTPPASVLAQLVSLPLAFPSGSRYGYSNSNFYLLGLVIERVSGQSYAAYLESEIFGPAGLGSTRYCPDEQSYPGAARGYAREDGVLLAPQPVSMTLPFAAGALCSTALDLVRWFEALSHGKVISIESFARMRTPGTLADGTSSAYGLGLQLGELEGHPRVGHGGGIWGFRAQADYYPADDLYVVVLANTQGDAPRRIAERLARRVLDSREPEQKHAE